MALTFKPSGPQPVHLAPAHETAPLEPPRAVAADPVPAAAAAGEAGAPAAAEASLIPLDELWAAEAGDPEPAPGVIPPVILPPGYQTMDTAPKDGRGVYLLEAVDKPEGVRSLFATGRRVVRGIPQKWSGWVHPHSREVIRWEPLGWRLE